jgi:hypothetical protein
MALNVDNSRESQMNMTLTRLQFEAEGVHKMAAIALNLAFETRADREHRKDQPTTANHLQGEIPNEMEAKIEALTQEIEKMRARQLGPQVVNINGPLYVINMPYSSRQPCDGEHGEQKVDVQTYATLQDTLQAIARSPQLGNAPEDVNSCSQTGSSAFVVSRNQDQ